MVKHVSVGLSYRMRYDLVANASSVDKKVLQIGLASGKCRQSDPPPPTYVSALIIYVSACSINGFRKDLLPASLALALFLLAVD